MPTRYTPPFSTSTTVPRERLAEIVRRLPGMMSGRYSDSLGASAVFRTVLAYAALGKIKEQFVVKARGGADETGLRWQPLSKKYLAYQRPMIGRNPPRAGKKFPGGKDGFFTELQMKQWKSIYARLVKKFALEMDPKQAKARAAAAATSVLRKQGAKFKIDVFGSRSVEILRDRGLLLNSLSPGTLTDSGGRVAYEPPEGQIFDLSRPGEVTIGTNVSYADAHHNATTRVRRPLWPDPGQWPMSWWDDWLDLAVNTTAAYLRNRLSTFGGLPL